jgi:hypothetical protein
VLVKRFYILLAFVFLLPFAATAKEKESITDFDINRFYDVLMDVASYEKYRDFYDRYIDFKDIAYDNFVKKVEESGNVLSGASECKLIGWEKSGKKFIVTVDIFIKPKKSSNKVKKRVHIALHEKNGRLLINSKEFFKIYEVKNKSGKRSNK